MAPETWGEAQGLFEFMHAHLENVPRQPFSLVVCPPFVFIEEASRLFAQSSIGARASLGAQDIFWDDSGSDTGEISGPMLAKLGVRSVIIGHSERRWKLGETDSIVNSKLKAVLRNEMTPIVCLGERERGADSEVFLRAQSAATFAGLTDLEKDKCLIAYEPVWAISTNPGARPDTPQSAAESIAVIRDALRTPGLRVLYGGSVTSRNAGEFFSHPAIDGLMVGGASINKEEFGKILSIASKLE